MKEQTLPGIADMLPGWQKEYEDKLTARVTRFHEMSVELSEKLGMDQKQCLWALITFATEPDFPTQLEASIYCNRGD
jgi:hypothetical protein